MATQEDSVQTQSSREEQVQSGAKNQGEGKQVKEKKKSITKCGENDLVINPQKVKKLEADPYLLEKALKVQEASFQRKLDLEIKHRREALNHKKNIIKALRKQERQNKRKGRK